MATTIAPPAAQRAGGIAALYLAAAYLAAMPFFLLVLDYRSVTEPSARLALILAHQGQLYAFNLLAYVLFGLALAVLALALAERLAPAGRLLAQVIGAWGLIWAALLIASGMVANMGMEIVAGMSQRDGAGAVAAWQIVETIADGLGGTGGEAIGGPWVLAISLAGLRARSLPRGLIWLGLAAGVAGVASNIPPLREAAILFGLLQIVWMIWLAAALLRRPS